MDINGELCKADPDQRGLFGECMDENLSVGFLADSSISPEDLDLSGMDNSWMNNITLEDIIAGIDDTHKPPEAILSPVAASVGNQTLNDLLNAPPVPATNFLNSRDPTFQPDEIQQNQVNTHILPPSSPPDVKPDIKNITTPYSGGPVTTLPSFPPNNFQTLGSSSSGETPQAPQIIFNIQASGEQTLLQNAITESPVMHAVVSNGNLQQQVGSPLQQTNKLSNEQTVPAVQGINLVALLQQNPQIKAQLQQQFLQGQIQNNQGQVPVNQHNINTSPTVMPVQQIVVPVLNNSVSSNSLPKTSPVVQSPSNMSPLSSQQTVTEMDCLKSFSMAEEQKPKKSSHNAVEKRYRCSINDKIGELRDMLMGSNTKSNKATVLKKAIDYIKFLTNANKRLQKENAYLRKHLTLNERLTVRGLIEEPDEDMIPVNPNYLTPPHSDPPDSPSAPESPQSIDEILTGKEVQQRMNGGIDKGRAALCLLMVAFLTFNPIGSTFQYMGSAGNTGSDSNFGTGRRMLQSESEVYSRSWFEMCATWMANLAITLLILFKLFAHDGPNLVPHSDNYVEFWRHRKQADSDVKRGDYKSASKHLRQCLAFMGQSLPTSRFGLFCALVWSFFRLVVGQLRITHWLSRKSSKHTETTGKSAQAAAEVFHKLNQLQMTDYPVDGGMSSVLYAINAINMAEVAGKQFIADDFFAELYTCAALRVSVTAPDAFYFLVYLFLTKARHILKNSTAKRTAHMQWICHPLGYKFITEEFSYSSCTKSDNSDMFMTPSNPANLIETLSKNFARKLLNKAFYALVTPQKSQASNGNDSSQTANSCIKNQSIQALEYVQLARDSSMTSDGNPDILCEWWCDIVSASAYWFMGKDDEASSFASSVESIPKSLRSTRNPLPLAIYTAFVTRRDYLALEDASVNLNLTISTSTVLKKCATSSQYLKDSLLYTKPKAKSIETAVQLLACDWLLSTRTGLWQTEYCSEDTTRRAPIDCLTAFEQDVNSLRRLAQVSKPVMPQVYLYEATERIMAGACPTRTRQLLGRTLRKRHRSKGETERHQTEDAGPRERTAALMLACRHLPQQLLTVPTQRADMLQEAVTTLEQLGDKRGMRDCQQMLLKLGSAGSGTVVTT